MNELIGLILLPALAICVMALSRRTALAALVIGTLFMSHAYAVELFGFTLFPNRLLSFLAFARVLWRGEFDRSRLIPMDRLLVLLYAVMTLILVLRPDESPALRMARALDVLLGYFACRGLLATPNDLRWLLRLVALLLVPYVLLLAYEMATQHNVFFPGNEGIRQWIREDRVRCFGSFRHPSLLGSLGATFFPLFVVTAVIGEERKRAVMGAVLGTGVVLLSNSGGPVSVLATGVVALCFWPLRRLMGVVCAGMFTAIVALDLVMKAPVWYLLMRLSSVTGGTGWHRSYLIDMAVQDLGRWWLAGLPIAETRHWFPYFIEATGGADITNQYIAFGLNAGLLGLILFLAFITCAYRYLGRAMHALRERDDMPGYEEGLLWGLGAMLTVHVFNWLGITYFDQFVTIWVLQMAAIASLAQYWLDEGEAEDAEADEVAEGDFPLDEWQGELTG